MSEKRALTAQLAEEMPPSTERRDSPNPALVYLSELSSPTSRRTMASKLSKFAQWAHYMDLRDCEWEKVSPRTSFGIFCYSSERGDFHFDE